MTILFIFNSSGLGGANRSLLTLMQYLKEENVTMYALLPERGMVEKDLIEYVKEYRVIGYRRCDMPPGYRGIPWAVNILRIPQIVKVVKVWKPDILHTNSSSHDIGFVISCIVKKPHVWHIRESLESHYQSHFCFPKIYKWERKHSECVICISDFVYDINAKQYSKENMVRVYNPFNIEDYFQKRSGFAIEKDGLSILVAGNITKSKGQREAVEALNILMQRGSKYKDVRLVIVGEGYGKEIYEIEHYIKRNCLENNCKLLPFCEDLSTIRSQSDIILNCSVDEALGRVTIEGMLSGCLAIGNNTGGTAEVIGNNNERGLLYEHGDALDLADKIAYAFDNREECFQMLMRGQDYVMRTFDYKKNCKEVMRIYQALLSER